MGQNQKSKQRFSRVFSSKSFNSIGLATAVALSGMLGGCSAMKSWSDTSTPPLPVVAPPPVMNWPNVTPTAQAARKDDPAMRIARQTRTYTEQVAPVIQERVAAQERADEIRQAREERDALTADTLTADTLTAADGVGIGETIDPTIGDEPIASSTVVAAPTPLSGPESIEHRRREFDQPTKQPVLRTPAPQTPPARALAPEQSIVASQSNTRVNTPISDPDSVVRELTQATNSGSGGMSVGSSVGNLANPTQVDLVASPADALTQSFEALQAKARQQPDDVVAQLDSQLARYLNNEPVPAAGDLEQVAPEDRELVSAVIDGLVNFRNTARANPDALSADRARPLVEMADRIKAGNELRVANVTLCKSVRGFGNYEPIEPRFLAGQPTTVVLYSEVENFTSAQVGGDKWQTRLAYEVRIYTELGMEVWSERSENVTDHARRKRTDFFVNKMIRLPANLTIGRYMLKVTVRDLQANRMAESMLPVQFVARIENLSAVPAAASASVENKPSKDNK